MLAALGSGMLGLAAEETDGTVLWMTGPRTIRSHVMPSLRAALPAGQPSPRVVCVLPVCVTDDPAAARARAATAFAAYGSVPSYRAMLEREGAAGPADVAIVGNEDSVTAQLTELREAGVSDFVMTEFTVGDESRRTHALITSLFAQLQDPATA
jgi:alkanesulfonate monooxygenase SsuD/methylene tetrahydromethanopterin reductase-like flavin-dependent oxidoreductase (luciferase family)